MFVQPPRCHPTVLLPIQQVILRWEMRRAEKVRERRKQHLLAIMQRPSKPEDLARALRLAEHWDE